MGVNLQRIQAKLGNGQINGSIAFDLSKITHTPKQSIGNSRRTPATAGNFYGRSLVDGNLEDAGRPIDDGGE